MGKLQKTLCALTAILLVECTSTNKSRNIAEFVSEQTVETRVVDLDKDGHSDIVYLAKTKKGYELRVMFANNDGSFRDSKLIKNYGDLDPRTLEYLRAFYSDISRVIKDKAR